MRPRLDPVSSWSMAITLANVLQELVRDGTLPPPLTVRPVQLPAATPAAPRSCAPSIPLRPVPYWPSSFLVPRPAPLSPLPPYACSDLPPGPRTGVLIFDMPGDLFATVVGHLACAAGEIGAVPIVVHDQDDPHPLLLHGVTYEYIAPNLPPEVVRRRLALIAAQWGLPLFVDLSPVAGTERHQAM